MHKINQGSYTLGHHLDIYKKKNTGVWKTLWFKLLLILQAAPTSTSSLVMLPIRVGFRFILLTKVCDYCSRSLTGAEVETGRITPRSGAECIERRGFKSVRQSRKSIKPEGSRLQSDGVRGGSCSKPKWEGSGWKGQNEKRSWHRGRTWVYSGVKKRRKEGVRKQREGNKATQRRREAPGERKVKREDGWQSGEERRGRGRWDVHWPVRDLGCHPDLFQLAVVKNKQNKNKNKKIRKIRKIKKGSNGKMRKKNRGIVTSCSGKVNRNNRNKQAKVSDMSIAGAICTVGDVMSGQW